MVNQRAQRPMINQVSLFIQLIHIALQLLIIAHLSRARNKQVIPPTIQKPCHKLTPDLISPRSPLSNPLLPDDSAHNSKQKSLILSLLTSSRALIKSAKLLSFSCFSILTATGCSTVKMSELHLETNQHSSIESRYYDVNIPSFDGTIIKATVFQPELMPYEEAPLLIHAHGWGTWRMKGTVGLHATFMMHGKAGLKAWRKGYWVISIDQRGFGASQGKVNVMDPDVEVKDAMAVIDWAVEHLPKLAFDDRATRDPKVGMLGESYGGQLQLLASTRDPRIDAIVPMTTWHNLAEAIAPNGHLKSFWTTLFFGLGSLTSGFDMHPDLMNPKHMKTIWGKMTPEMQSFLYDRSIAKACDQQRYPQADTLLIQGFRDTIFPLNHAVDNFDCAQQGVDPATQQPNDVRLLVMQGGHLLPTQKPTGMPIYNTERVIHCEDKAIDLSQVMVDWFDAKLLNQTDKLSDIPALCMTQDYKSGIVSDTLPIGGESIAVHKHEIRPGVAGLFEVVAKPIDWVSSIPKRLFSRDKPLAEIENRTKPTGGVFRPAFVPLKIADRTGVITGIALADLLIESKNEDVTLFAAIGIKKPDRNGVRVISEQVQPLSGRGFHAAQLPGVSSNIERGDVIGLVVYGTSTQYFLNRSFGPWKTEISGTVELPLLRKSGDGYVAYSSPDPMIDNIAANEGLQIKKRDSVGLPLMGELKE